MKHHLLILVSLQTLVLLTCQSVFAQAEQDELAPEASPPTDSQIPKRIDVPTPPPVLEQTETDTADEETEVEPATEEKTEEMAEKDEASSEEEKMAESAPTPEEPTTESKPEVDPEELAKAAKSKTLKSLIAEQVGKTSLESGKQLQIRSMALTAYEQNDFENLWPTEIAGNSALTPVAGAFQSLGDLLLAHYFKNTELSFSPELPELAEDSPVSAEDLLITLGLAETCLRMKQGPETESEWPNWTYGDNPLPTSTSEHYDEVTARFGKVAAEANLPMDVANDFVPKNWVYLRLHQELQKDLEAPEPPSIEIEGLIKVDNEFDQAKVLAEYLVQEEFLKAEALETIDGIYTKDLSEAVRSYQKANDLQSDGILGPSTAKHISKVDENVESRLITNLHRARRLPDSMGDRYLIANLPSGEIHGVQNDEETIRMRVVFGKDKAGQHTPLFRDKMETVVFRPYWNVPYSIAVGESQYSDLGYLGSKGFKIISSSSGAALPMTGSSLSRVVQRTAYVRQEGGDSNALGLVKFLFPNKHAVYFHDTPSKHLFAKNYRAYSHGCVRLQHPEDMANWVLSDFEEWNENSIHKALFEGDRTQVDLKEHIPVYIVYFTAFPDPKEPDVVNVHRDYYDYDKPGAIIDAPGPKTKPKYTSPLEEEERRGPFSIFRKYRTNNPSRPSTSNRSSSNRSSNTTRSRPILDKLRALQN